MIRVLGVMTGTSCDGLDAACLGFSSDGQFEPLWEASRPFPGPLRKRVLELQKPNTSKPLRTWLELNRDLGAWLGKSLKSLIDEHETKPDVIANHGQTVGHFPMPGSKGFTCQMGDPSRIATQTGLTVVASFREGDMAAGGEGAPLVPYFHRVLSARIGGEGLSIHNIGGISNLTWIGPEGNVVAFDTGPGNLWIDEAAALASQGKLKFDRGGRLALSGEPDWEAVSKILRDPYFKKAPPKSTGRDDFPFKMLTSSTRARGANLVSTAMWVTVESIAQSYERSIIKKGLPLQTILVCGGGSNNTALMEALRSRLPFIEVESLSETGLNPQFIEAQAFALFGFMALQGSPIGGPWTGARGFAPPAHIVPGENWNSLLRSLHTIRTSSPS